MNNLREFILKFIPKSYQARELENEEKLSQARKDARLKAAKKIRETYKKWETLQMD